MSTRRSSGRFHPGAMLLAGALLLGCDPGDRRTAAEPLLTSGGVLTTPVEIADPHRTRFPGNTLLECFGRSIWDLHSFAGRVYVGGGDSWNNSGPTAVWSFTDDGVTTDVRLETVVDDEQVAQFRDFGGRLYIPGVDATESWDYGNFYVTDGDVWQKRRTVPNALHVWDIAALQGKLYAFIRNQRGDEYLVESADDGATWQPLPRKMKVFAGGMVAFDDILVTMGNCPFKGCLSTFGSGTSSALRIPQQTFWLGRSERFGAAVLYTDTNYYLTYVDYHPALYVAGVPKGPYQKISDFGDHVVAGTRDILVEGQTAYVLRAARHPTDRTAYVGYIYSSTDLRQWTKLAQFVVPAPPYSFARLDGRFYVGLGADGLVDDPAAVPLPKSGSIWRLQ